MDKNQQFLVILKQYGLTSYLTKELKEYEYISSKRIYKKILKKIGIYNFFMVIYFSFFFFLKKIGINFLTFKIILSVIILGCVSISGYIIIKQGINIFL